MPNFIVVFIARESDIHSFVENISRWKHRKSKTDTAKDGDIDRDKDKHRKTASTSKKLSFFIISNHIFFNLKNRILFNPLSHGGGEALYDPHPCGFLPFNKKNL